MPLATDRCKVLASPEDIANDATVWVGAMYPVSEPDRTSYGPLAERAVDLARRDFSETTGGLPPAKPGGPPRPIGLVLCDDLTSLAGADHLVRDLRVPAVLGFALSKEVMDLMASHFLPNGVLALASNTASSLRHAPRAPGEPRLLYRVTTSVEMVALPAARLMPFIERDVRAAKAVAPGEPLRVAMVRLMNISGQTLADLYTAQLRFNDKSVVDNGDRFRQFASPDRIGAPNHLDAEVLSEIVAFAPHVVVFAGIGLSPAVQIERAWPKDRPFRPRYLDASSDMRPDFVQHVAENPELRRRVVLVDGASGSPALAKFVGRYNEVYKPPIDAANATCAPYDAFYLFAYAAAALGEKPLTGRALAAAIPRLLGPGEVLDVGPGGIYAAYSALATGKNIDLRGSATTLDFDLETGDATADAASYCVTPGTPSDPPRTVESGLRFIARTGAMEGTMRCP